MTPPLHDRKALVTGGGRGIGATVARALAKSGAHVVVAARTAEQVQAVAADIAAGGHAAMATTVDVTDEASVAALFDLTGDVDILVCAAGIGHSAPLARESLADWNRVMAVNATGPFLCLRAALPGMCQRGWGRAVVIASTASTAGAPYISAYAASKHAALGLVRCAALEAAAKGGAGVTVNALCPGYVDTPMTDASVANIVARTGMSPEDARATLEATSPQRRLIHPDEIAATTLWLCHDEARGINGAALPIAGGA